MNMAATRDPDGPVSTPKRIAAYLVHGYTALGAWFGLMAVNEIIRHDNRMAFVWMTIAVLIDASDGWMARTIDVKSVVPQIDGTKLDDIVDYLTFTFVPLLMIYYSGWLPSPAALWLVMPMIGSLFAFVHTGAKEAGFFRGFPSYWNIVAFYIAIWFHQFGNTAVLVLVAALSVLSVVPIRFVYPTRTDRFAAWFVIGGLTWLPIVGLILWKYFDAVPGWLLILSLLYPAFYMVMSIYLDITSPRQAAASSE